MILKEKSIAFHQWKALEIDAIGKKNVKDFVGCGEVASGPFHTARTVSVPFHDYSAFIPLISFYLFRIWGGNRPATRWEAGGEIPPPTSRPGRIKLLSFYERH